MTTSTSPIRSVRTAERAEALRRLDLSASWMVGATFAGGLGLILLGLTGVWQIPGLTLRDAPSWWFVPPLAVGCLALLAKRTRPTAALVVGALAFAADTVLGGSIAGFLYFLDLLYTAALVGSARLRRTLWIAAGALVVGPSIATLTATLDLRWAVLVALQQAVIFLGPLWWAKDVRTSKELAIIAAARADAVEQLAGSVRREAIRSERDSLARELHDAVASHLSAIALHSGGALATPAEPAKDRQALGVVRSSALESMREMHSLISLLRDPDAGDERRRHEGARFGGPRGPRRADPTDRREHRRHWTGTAGRGAPAGRPRRLPDRAGGSRQCGQACCR
ncbi:hypothetical protein GM708_05185 [Vibrio cholerae]|nr:hypothetical protein [Vibrio cholerae]